MQGQQQAMQQQQQMQQAMRNNMQNQMRGNMGPGGGPGMPGAAGSRAGGGNDKPPDFRSPRGAVQAFLDALEDRDLDRLTEATALRAQTEASNKNKELFKRIFDSTLSESELNDLANRLEGYTVASENQAKSTGKLDVVLMKVNRPANQASSGVMGGGASYRLRITVRREKKGWGVCDISTPTEFKNPAMYNPYAKKRS
jgi:hypothetical protein